MSFKIEKIAYEVPMEKEKLIYRQIKNEVKGYLLQEKNKKSASLLVKAIVIGMGAILFFVIAMTAVHPLVIISAYLLFGWCLLLLGFNLGHDAAHRALPASRRMNAIIFETIFALLGANPYLWKLRHIHSHHPYPNVDGCDADIELTTLLKFSASGKWKKMHRYQFMYAPFLYTVYTLYWIFYKDIILFTRKKQANIHFDRHPISEWIKLFLYKIFYLLLMIGLPVILHPQFAMIYGIAFLVMHMINSVFLLFTFLISHHVPHTQAAGENKNSWMMQQVLSSADFHAESKWAYWIFGGFNAHTAHHLFPGISHVHYPGITRIIREHLVANGLPYHSFSFFKGIQWHLILLKETGKEVVRH